MSLSASMWTGISGLLAHGERMNVIGNNIANVNTLGYKGSRMDFEDFIYQDVNTSAGTAQLGRGVAISAIMGDFSQGAMETTNESTDLAIGGKGFFRVKVKNEETTYYTRAGNFRFDKEGYLVDPHGYPLQGWEIEQAAANISSGAAADTETSSAIKGSGVPKDILLSGFTADPRHTSNITMVANLNASTGGDNSTSATNPFFAMFENWDGQDSDEPIGETRFAYQSTLKIYDEGGTSHNLTVYFDQVSLSNAPSGKRYWEYMVTVNPLEDNRNINNTLLASSAAAGILMTGSLTFDTAGQLTDMSAFTLKSSASGNMAALSNWAPTQFSTNGYPMMVANFSGISNASYVTPTVASAADPFVMELNFGLKNGATTGWDSGGTISAAGVGITATNLPSLGTNAERGAQATTSFSGTSSTLLQSQDGYTFGYLQNVTVSRDGILQGRYSNGEVLDLFQVTLFDFQNKWALNREGGNLFSETRDSGEALPGPANANGYGSISSNSLEQSNVDLAKEFVTMITTQRGFQANSKVITTTDTMLAEVIALKR